MADHAVPHFHNQPGVRAVEIGAKEFMCIGALPPLDHPHIFIDMGDDGEAICGYCSTSIATIRRSGRMRRHRRNAPSPPPTPPD